MLVATFAVTHGVAAVSVVPVAVVLASANPNLLPIPASVESRQV